MARGLGKFIHDCAHSAGVSTWVARNMKVMRIIMFHGVGDDECPEVFFIQQLKYLATHFDVVPLHVMLDRLDTGKGCSGREVVLTFDDGLRNNYTIVYPLLRELGLPATFFVCPGLIESGRWLWNHEARQRLIRMSECERKELSAPFGRHMNTTEQIIAWMKGTPWAVRIGIEEQIRNMTPRYQPTSEERNRFDIMTWEDLTALSPELITIGAHTTSHAILGSLDDDVLSEEIEGCRCRLEAWLQRPVDLFCYPNGIHTPKVVQNVRAAYRAGVTTEPGVVLAGDDPFVLKRITVAPELSYFSWRMHRPAA